MITGVRQKTVVKENGRIEICSPELPGGAIVEVIVLVEPESKELETTEYLLSTEANRNHLVQALRELQDPSGYVYVNPDAL